MKSNVEEARKSYATRMRRARYVLVVQIFLVSKKALSP